jgi:branched-chain amino acid transport system ATP-binding protein
MPADRTARAGIAYVPRAARSSQILGTRKPAGGGASGTTGRDDWPLARILATFPRNRRTPDQGGQQLSGGEQQMLAIGRALTNPMC